MGRAAAGLYSDVRVEMVFDEKATRDNLEATVDRFAGGIHRRAPRSARTANRTHLGCGDGKTDRPLGRPYLLRGQRVVQPGRPADRDRVSRQHRAYLGCGDGNADRPVGRPG